MKQLFFSNPSFNEGINITCRRGIKWGLQIDNSSNFDLELMDVESNNVLSHANIIKQVTMRFCDLLDSDLALEQDESCRTKEGLLESMKEIYECFDEREIISLVYFKIV